ncbi:MAG: hypothetical protein A2444_03675 [Candidatus Staskawiczbacteria bacterium RIFOXYC2_FULL_37_19]|nr:MAG: hypothetical protein A2444_03675 [Candidatus Staskawiczbacteria bacterium RIFOXYC2_FULL_37_19]
MLLLAVVENKLDADNVKAGLQRASDFTVLRTLFHHGLFCVSIEVLDTTNVRDFKRSLTGRYPCVKSILCASPEQEISQEARVED